MNEVNNNTWPALIVGIIIGIVLTLIVLASYGFYIYNKYNSSGSKPKQSVSLNTAYVDDSTCPDSPPSALLGQWGGSAYYTESGETQEWVNTRKADGTYHLDFTFTKNGKVTRSQEDGYWAYSGCLYTVIILRINDKAVKYQEIYRIHEVTDTQMKYTSFRTGTEFVANRI